MSIKQEQLGYSEIEIKVDACLEAKDSIEALLLIKRRFDICSDIEEICNLFLLKAWIFYKHYQYHEIALEIIDSVLNKEHPIKNKNKILLKCYYVKSLIHFQRGKYMLCHQTIEDILKIDRDNNDAKTMMEIIQSRIRVD